MLRAMPVAPPQIPWHAGYSYFELEEGSELWHEMDKSGALRCISQGIPGSRYGVLGHP
ncbi:MAG: type VI secretion system baseplate subunit TssK [Enterobacter hormaechei]